MSTKASMSDQGRLYTADATDNDRDKPPQGVWPLLRTYTRAGFNIYGSQLCSAAHLTN